MNLTFRIRFATQPGQSLTLNGSHPLPAHPVPMAYRDAESWEVSIPLATQALSTPFQYHYAVRQGGAQSADWGQTGDRCVCHADFKGSNLLIIDTWNSPGFYANAFATTPFKEVLLAEHFTEFKQATPAHPTHTFRVKAPLLRKNQTLCLLGEGMALGNWQTVAPVLMNRLAGQDYLSVQLDLRSQTFPFRYKYGVYDLAQKSLVTYEAGQDRVLQDELARDKHTLVNDGLARLPDDTWRGTGVAIPVFALRTEKSGGVGEFLDLIPLADWGREVGLKLIQLLPVNDTSATGTWKDSYPYAAISVFALHPQYLNLAALATDATSRKWLKALEPQRQKLNRLKTVDYEAVMKLKLG
ncbi:MAG TPA: 4-alpha-glucanotransferase, partial [Verrucomicrobiae bacterium]